MTERHDIAKDVSMGQRGVLRKALAALVACVSLACACLCLSGPAYAFYNDVASSYGTINVPDPSGDPISAQDVPNGRYGNIEVNTSSSFCNISNCVVVKNDEGMFATFTLSKSYSAVFLGTAEEAAASTNEDGTDDSAYAMGKEVTVGKGKLNQFTIGLAGFNSIIDLATFNGGSQGLEKGCWYDRSVVFEASSEVILAMQSGTGPEEQTQEPEKEDKPDSKKDDSDKQKTGASSKKSDSKKAAKTKKSSKKKEVKKKTKKASKEKTGSTATIITRPGSTHAESNSGNKTKEQDGESGSRETSKAPPKLHGVPLSFASLDLEVGDTTAAVGVNEQTASSGGIDLRLVAVAAVTAVLMACGFALRMLLFRREKTK